MDKAVSVSTLEAFLGKNYKYFIKDSKEAWLQHPVSLFSSSFSFP